MHRELESEIKRLKLEIEQLKSQVTNNGIYCLQTSFETNAYEDLPKKSIKCPICSKTIKDTANHLRISTNFWNTGDLIRVECPHCDVVFGPLSIINRDSRRLSEDYKILYTYYKEGETPIYQKMAFDRLKTSKEKNYLNYACGDWKNGIENLRNDGWNIYGYEPNLPYQTDSIKTDFKELSEIKFDALMTHNFIEHIQNPIQVFTEWNQMLQIGNKMVHSSPCFKWKFDFSNFHLYFFLGKSLDILAKRTGFRVLEYEDYKPDIDSEYTRIVTFEKIRNIDRASTNSINFKSIIHNDKLQESQSLKKRINVLPKAFSALNRKLIKKLKQW